MNVTLETYKLGGCKGFFAFLYVDETQYDVNPCDTLHEIIAEGEALARELGVSIGMVC